MARIGSDAVLELCRHQTVECVGTGQRGVRRCRSDFIRSLTQMFADSLLVKQGVAAQCTTIS